MRPAISIALLTIGCTDVGSAETGEVSINLVGQVPSGATYRLRDATITVEGPTTTRVFRTEDDPSRSALEDDVGVGNYTSTLAPGWRLERVHNGIASTRDALLTSPNPFSFLVDEDERTIVPFKFAVEGEELNLAQGYGIVLDIEETDCGNAIVEVGEKCDDGNTAHYDGCDNRCRRGPPDDLEPNEDGTPSPGGDPLLGNDFAIEQADLYGSLPLRGPEPAQRVVNGTLNPRGDEDVYPIRNTSNVTEHVAISTVGEAAGHMPTPCTSTQDTVLVVRSSTGAVLAMNDDAGSGTKCSRVQFFLAPGELRYIQVLAASDGALMSYGLVVQ